jgi:hypothetical protein
MTNASDVAQAEAILRWATDTFEAAERDGWEPTGQYRVMLETLVTNNRRVLEAVKARLAVATD